MKIILKESINKVGKAGEVVDVKNGYARNYLIPQGKAVHASESQLRHFEEIKKQAERRAELTVEKAKELADKLEVTPVTIPVQTGEEDRIHGTVTNQNIADALAERDIEVDRRKITLDEDVKALGEYTATVDLLGDLKPKVKVWVVKAD